MVVQNTNGKEVFSINDAANYLSISRQTVYNWLNNGIIKGKRMSNRKILFLKDDLLKIFHENQAYEHPTPTERKPITEFYTINEVKEKFNIGNSWAFKIIRENNIPKTKIGGVTHVSMKHIDDYFKKKRDDISNITEWYTVKEVQNKFNLTRDQIYNRIHDNAIPKQRIGKYIKVSKQHFDELFILRQ